MSCASCRARFPGIGQRVGVTYHDPGNGEYGGPFTRLGDVRTLQSGQSSSETVAVVAFLDGGGITMDARDLDWKDKYPPSD